MRTVIHKLRSTSKIELIGGAYYITELTSKVSSASNIRTHAALVVETGLKRAMIVLASKIHTQAYEDDCDAFELLDKITSEFEFFKKFNLPQDNESQVKAFWDKHMLIEKPPPDEPVIYLEDIPVCTLGNYSLLIGKKKSRKTLFIVLLMAEYLRLNPANASKILLFDNEQGKSDVWLLREKIHQLTGLWIPIFSTRGMDPKDRRTMIAGTVKYWQTPPVFVIIDGIRDLMSNINDPDESTQLIVWLEKLTIDYHLHVINILHMNKTDFNARGHIGSELLNKSEVTIELELDEKNKCTVVKCESSRRRAFETFAFTHDENGLPVVIGTPMRGNIVPMDEKRRRLQDIFEDSTLKYPELVEGLKNHFAIGVGKAKSMITELIRQGYILKSGKDHSPDTVYKLLSTVIPPNGHEKPSKTATFVASDPKNGQHVEKIELNIFEPDDLPF
jgi:hypothetical protein